MTLLTLFDVAPGPRPDPADPLGLIILIVIAVGFFAIFGAAGLALWFFMRRRRQTQPAVASPPTVAEPIPACARAERI